MRALLIPSSPRRPCGRTPPPVRALLIHPSTRACLAAPPIRPCGLASPPRRPCVPIRSAHPPVRPHLAARASPSRPHPAVCVPISAPPCLNRGLNGLRRLRGLPHIPTAARACPSPPCPAVCVLPFICVLMRSGCFPVSPLPASCIFGQTQGPVPTDGGVKGESHRSLDRDSAVAFSRLASCFLLLASPVLPLASPVLPLASHLSPSFFAIRPNLAPGSLALRAENIGGA